MRLRAARPGRPRRSSGIRAASAEGTQEGRRAAAAAVVKGSAAEGWRTEDAVVVVAAAVAVAASVGGEPLIASVQRGLQGEET